MAAVVALVSLALSLVLYYTTEDLSARRTLFFPARPLPTSELQIMGEQRRLPPRRGLEEKVRQTVEELILGPAEPRSLVLVPRGTRLRSVVVDERRAYISFSRELIERGTDVVLPPEEVVRTVAYNLYFNFPSLRRVYVLIEGRAPDWSAARGDRGLDFSDGVPFERPQVR